MLAGAKEQAVNVMFADPHLSEAVTFRPISGGQHAVRAMVRAPDEVQGFGSVSLQSGTLILHVRIADMPTIEAGDVVNVRDEIRKVQGHPRRDSTGLIFEVNTVPV